MGVLSYQDFESPARSIGASMMPALILVFTFIIALLLVAVIRYEASASQQKPGATRQSHQASLPESPVGRTRTKKGSEW